MSNLERKALASLPLTAAEVEAIYEPLRRMGGGMVESVRRLCESHERLRMELQGAEAMLADGGKGGGP